MSKRHKWGAKPTVVDGTRFDSKREAAVYVELRTLHRAGKIKRLTLQPAFLLQPAFEKNGRLVREIDYVADFMVEWAEGSIQRSASKDPTKSLVDVKGKPTDVYLLKKKLFHFKYPEWTIEEWK